jgi:hypothetical protein
MFTQFKNKFDGSVQLERILMKHKHYAFTELSDV